MTDWNELQKEYITGTMSISELAEAHGLSRNTVAARHRRGQWQKLREEIAHGVRTQCTQKLIDSASTTEADRLARMMRRSDRLGELCDMWIDRAVEKGAKPQDIKAMADALLKLSEIGKVAEPEDTEIVFKFEQPDWAE